ncbi:inositol monophosphatase family protein [Burkholderia sp. Cy-637]|uniref:inositol monophosphatase family protein n=1 Tax=Burkholderia sp. Cy-637 TaxID=2608327 RepID=UPI0014210C2A|nr:inositol monophosphatase family protein [Burkholderia sp. Cy-637]NIF87293.1 inositol phosphatase [Burkholderia sp. Cy-637]
MPAAACEVDTAAYRQTIERMCALARGLALRALERPVGFERKADASPVTALDREIELALRELVRRRHPRDAILGEEFGEQIGEACGPSAGLPADASAAARWIIDPLDGTRAFATGSPLWGTLIGVLRDGRPWLGAIELPALDQRLCSWQASAWASPRRIGEIRLAGMATTTPDKFTPRQGAAFQRLREHVGTHRYGGDCFNYAALVAGRCDLVVEAGLAAHDYLPIVPLVEAAGGRITDWQGRELSERSAGDVVAAADPLLHRAVLDILAAGMRD